MKRGIGRSIGYKRPVTMLIGIVLTGSVLFAGAALAQSKPDDKIDQQLRNLADPAFAEQPPTAGHLIAKPLPMRTRDGQVLIDAVAANGGAALAADLAALGAENVTRYGKTVSGWLPTDAIGQLKELESLRFARPSYATTNVGITTSQGDQAMYAGFARSLYGVNGSGIKVGVLSDSFDNAAFLFATDQAQDVFTGDLPPGIEILKEGPPGIDEGRAMAQLIHDVAPGADLSFHTAFDGLADFAIAIEELAGCPAGSSEACGTTATDVDGSESGASELPADVIVDDIIYFAEPMFQDGVIAQAADTVADAEIPYFSSIGNNERLSYESEFNPGPSLEFDQFPDCGIGTLPPPVFQGIAHDFDPGPGVDIFQEFTINPGEDVDGPFVFQWDQPYASQNTGGVGSASDHDIFLVLTDDGGLGIPTPCTLQGSTNGNLFGGDPLEIMGGIGLGPAAANPVKVAIVIVKFIDFGPDAGLMKWVSFGGNRPDEFDTFSPTGYGHANAAGAEGVGAAPYTQTPGFFVLPPLIEPFSSAGGVPILFDTAGNRLADPEVRLKPGITAPDGTNTTFFGNDVEPDGFPNFFGTSAAAPHAAAVAALMLDANPNLTPTEIYEIMRDTAFDMDDPSTPAFDAGFDFGTGAGFINARKAVQEARKRSFFSFFSF